MRRAVLLVLLGLTLSLSAAPAPFPKRTRGEKATLEGTWKLIRLDGEYVDPTKLSILLVVAGNQMRFVIREDDRTEVVEATLTLGTGTSPKPIDIRLTRRIKGGDTTKKDELLLSIYKIEGNLLTLHLGDDDKRPKDFAESVKDDFVFARLSR